jgi:hypothetical protein
MLYLKENGTRSATMDEFEAFLQMPGTLEKPALVVRCRFVDGLMEHRIVVDNPRRHRRLYVQFLPFLDRIRQRVRCQAEVFVLLSDTIYVAKDQVQRWVDFLRRVPFLRADQLEGDPLSSYAIMIPDPFIQEDIYGKDIEKISEVADNLPFSDRHEIIKWRGRLSGPGYPDSDNCHCFPRYHFAKLAATVPSIIDARITNYANIPNTTSGTALKAELDGLLGGLVPEIAPWEFVAYKYLISFEGATTTWKRVANSLWTGSTLLLQHKWKQFFYPGLVAWVHYVPIADDSSDLLDRYAWLRANPAVAERIGSAGRHFAQNLLSVREIENYFIAVLESCAALTVA